MIQLLSDFIGDLIVSFANIFGELELDDSPFKVIGAALACPRGLSKMAAEWHDLLNDDGIKGTLVQSPVLPCFVYSVTGETVIGLPKASPAGREWMCIFN